MSIPAEVQEKKFESSPRSAESYQQHYLATHDLLTGLHNEKIILDRVQHEIKYGERYGLKFAVLLIDLSHFSGINQTLGISFGDCLLKETAKRIKSCVRSTDTVARLEADRFLVLLPNIITANQVARIATKRLDQVSQPLIVEMNEYAVSASLAITLFPHDGDHYQKLMHCLRVTLKRIKDSGGNGYQFYSNDITDTVQHRDRVERTLKKSLSNNHLEMTYQPVLNIRSGSIVQLKSCLNFKADALQYDAHDLFADSGIEQQLLQSMEDWLLQNVAEQIRHWRSKGISYQVVIELASHRYLDFSVIDKFERLLQEYGIEQGYLALEIKQHMLLENPQQAPEFLQQLKALGITIIIADFGNGPTQLSTLKDLPIDYLKLSRTLVENLEYTEADQVIAFGILTIAKGLGISVIAPGVDNKELLGILSQLNCFIMQGEVIHQKLAPDDVLKL